MLHKIPQKRSKRMTGLFFFSQERLFSQERNGLENAKSILGTAYDKTGLQEK